MAKRELKFTASELRGLMEKYFKETPLSDWTWTGLARACHTSKVTLDSYRKRDDELGEVADWGCEEVHYSYELDNKRHGRAGTIFALKNYGWTDKQEIDHTSAGDKITSINVIFHDTTSNLATDTTTAADKTSATKKKA